MKENEIKELWKNDETWGKINFQESLEMKQFKSKKALRGLITRRIIESVIFILLFTWLTEFAISNAGTGGYYLISGIVLSIFCLVGFIGSIRQIAAIIKLDYLGSVTEVQQKLERLKAYNLQVIRLLMLSLPFYFAYIVIGFKAIFNVDIVTNGSNAWLISNLVITLLFIPLAIWIYKQLNLSSKKNWVKQIIFDNGGKQIRTAAEFFSEIKEFKNEG